MFDNDPQRLVQSDRRLEPPAFSLSGGRTGSRRGAGLSGQVWGLEGPLWGGEEKGLGWIFPDGQTDGREAG